MVGALGTNPRRARERGETVITRAQITRRADSDGLDAATVERDYALAHIVALVASKDTAGTLAFKGGTSLRLVHVQDYRYSADIDYSILSGSLAEARSLVAIALSGGNTESISGLSLTNDDPPRIAYTGPLRKPRAIKLDIASDEVVVHTESKALLARWPDLPATSVLVYTPLEIAGEKLRCVLQRLQCRDILDLDLLLGELGVDPVDAAQLFARKAKQRGLNPATFATKFEERTPEYRKRWGAELSRYLVYEVPHFEEVERRLRRALRRAGLL